MLVDVLFRVFHFCTVGTLLQKCSQVCREWNQIVDYIHNHNFEQNKLITVRKFINQLKQLPDLKNSFEWGNKTNETVWDDELFIFIRFIDQEQSSWFHFYSFEFDKKFDIDFIQEKYQFCHKEKFGVWCIVL